jgi:hypothetical protein
MKLLSKSPKTIKSDKAGKGYLTAIVYLAPHKLSGFNVCPNASAGCIAACLNTSGRGRMNSVQMARINKTKFYFENRETFKTQLIAEIKAFVRKCSKMGVSAAIRLNGTSDIPWESIFPELFTMFPNVQFYDYTKSYRRALLATLKAKWPLNYHLTFSRSECNQVQTMGVLAAGGSVAVVFDSKKIPATWQGFPVYNADETDLRFLDKPGIQGLYAKGKAKRDLTGFVVPVT